MELQLQSTLLQLIFTERTSQFAAEQTYSINISDKIHINKTPLLELSSQKFIHFLAITTAISIARLLAMNIDN